MTDRPKLPYGRQSVDEDDIAAVARVLRGDWLTTGPTVEAFEQALAERAGVPHAVVVSSGTAALHTGYAAAGLARGDEIVTSPLTFMATASAALHLGASVRLVDVDARTGNIDPGGIEAAMSAATKLVVAVDYAGHPADYDTLRPLVQARGARLVADAAHSFGAALHERPVGSLCDATVTSFHPVKPITTGEGGAIFTADSGWARRAAEFRNHGIVRDPQRLRGEGGAWYHEIQSLGLNYRMPDVLCALGLSQLAKLDRFIERRRSIAGRYLEAFGDVEGMELPCVIDGAAPGWHLFVVRVREAKRRRAFFDALREAGILTQLHYIPVHLHPLFQDLGYSAGRYPIAEDFAARAVSLPLYPAMSDADIEYAIDTVRDVAKRVL